MRSFVPQVSRQTGPAAQLSWTAPAPRSVRMAARGHASGVGESAEAARQEPRTTPDLPFRHDFSRIPVHAAPPAIQPKLRVGAPGDAHEREADQVAEQVMRMPEPRPQTGRQPSDDAGHVEAPATVHDVLRSPGHPLDASTRAFLEPRFGHDFSHVRVHTDAPAGDAALAIDARAFTAGSHVVFGAGEYAPQTEGGRHLLAHELTHVLQQGSPPADTPVRPARGAPAFSTCRPSRTPSPCIADPRSLVRLAQVPIAERSTGPILQRKAAVDDPPQREEREDSEPVGEAGGGGSAVTLKVQIVSGSKPAEGHPEEQKIFGGRKGGHVVINLGAEGVFGFSNDGFGGHFWARGKKRQNSKFEHYTAQEWNAKIKGKQVITYEIAVTLDQRNSIKAAFGGEPDVDWSVLGYRCASYALHALKEAGVIADSDFAIKYFLAVTPAALARFLKKRGHSPHVQPGGKTRKWKRFRMSPGP